MNDWKYSDLAGLSNPQQNVKFAVLDPNDTSTAPADSHGSDKTITGAQVGALASADIGRIFVAGHSVATGFQNTEGGEMFPVRLAAALRAELVLYGQTGAVLATDNASSHPGGYAAVLNGLTPRIDTGTVGAYAPRNAAPYLPLSPVVVFCYGSNDVQFLNSNITTEIAWYTMAQRAVICIGRAGGYFPDTDASVVYGGSGGSHWVAHTGQQQFGSPTNHQSSTVGDKVTITVPADFPGGEIDLLTVVFGGASGAGVKWSTTVDGGAAQILDGTGNAFGAATGRGNLVVQRLTGLSAGTHTIVATAIALDATATAIFDSWLIAAPNPPVTVLVNTTQFPGLPVTGGTHSPLTSADITALNTAVAGIAAGFTDQTVVVADVATAAAAVNGNVAAGNPGSLYTAGGEFNSAGHALVANTVLGAIRSAPVIGPARFCGSGFVKRQVNGPLEPQLTAGWTISPSNGGFFARTAAGIVTVNMSVTHAGSPAVFTTIMTLPPGYRPLAGFNGPCISWNGAFTTATIGSVAAFPDGTIEWLAGDPTTELDIVLFFLGDQVGA